MDIDTSFVLFSLSLLAVWFGYFIGSSREAHRSRKRELAKVKTAYENGMRDGLIAAFKYVEKLSATKYEFTKIDKDGVTYIGPDSTPSTMDGRPLESQKANDENDNLPGGVQ
jgi:hypothetical protein